MWYSSRLFRLLITALVVRGVIGVSAVYGQPVGRDAPQGESAQVERLGNPFAKPPYARNVWDMQLFNGHIYLGHGNSSNYEPSANAGPIPVLYYDPVTNKFVKQYTADQEQIDVYRVLNGTLFFPGHDPRGSKGGDIYRLDGDTWVSKIIDYAAFEHTYDVALFHNYLFVRTSTSPDMGETWQLDGESYCRSIQENPGYSSGRLYGIFVFRDKLYEIYDLSVNPTVKSSIYVIEHHTDPECFTHSNLEGVIGSNWMPDAPENTVGRWVRTTAFNDQLVSIGAAGVNDHQWSPFALYVTKELSQTQHILLPTPEAIPYDILVRGDAVYVLAAAPQPSGEYTIFVYGSHNLSDWTEMLHFNQPTFARSFEQYDGAFYFGLGCSTDALSEATGDILRVRVPLLAPFVPSPTPTSTLTPSSVPSGTSTPITSTPTPTALAPAQLTHHTRLPLVRRP